MSLNDNDLKMMAALVQHMQQQITQLASYCNSPMAQILSDELNASSQKLAHILARSIPQEGTDLAPAPLVFSSASPIPAVPQTNASYRPESNTASAKKTLFLIDDDKDAQKVLGYMFERKSSFRVVSYLDPLQAWAEIKINPPDVILMDLMMPGMSGMELLKHIRAIPELNAVKILIGSSKSFDKDRIEVLKAGANDFIAKPYNFTELLLRLNKLAG